MNNYNDTFFVNKTKIGKDKNRKYKHTRIWSKNTHKGIYLF